MRALGPLCWRVARLLRQRRAALRWLAGVPALLPALLMAASMPARSADRAELEAAIVYNILLFVDWPSDAVPAVGAPLVLCVDPGSTLAMPLRSLAGRAVRGWRLEVRELAPAASTQGCNALFIGGELSAHTLAPRHPLPPGAPVLVIDDQSAPPTASAMTAIHLDDADGRIAFDVNLAAARGSRLQISSRLLRLARKVIE